MEVQVIWQQRVSEELQKLANELVSILNQYPDNMDKKQADKLFQGFNNWRPGLNHLSADLGIQGIIGNIAVDSVIGNKATISRRILGAHHHTLVGECKGVLFLVNSTANTWYSQNKSKVKQTMNLGNRADSNALVRVLEEASIWFSLPTIVIEINDDKIAGPMYSSFRKTIGMT